VIIVLGIDSAISKCGWAVVERDGGHERLVAHGVLVAVDGEVVGDFAGRMAHGQRIDVVVIEDAYLDTNVDTVKKLSRLVGRWQQAFETLGLETTLVMGSVWQRQILSGLIGLTSPREARKKAAKLWARATFHEALGEDEADAAGLATWGARQRSFAARVAAAR
jgi:Holliday junction resolvasome RuvABC endonuclease subunit